MRTKSLGVRLALFTAAPAAVLLLGLVSAFWQNGFERVVASEQNVVGEVLPNGPAARAGIRAGDTITAIGGQRVDSWEAVKKAIRSQPGGPTLVDVDRNNDALHLEVTPETDPDDGHPVIGVSASMTVQAPPGFWRRLGASFKTVGALLPLFATAVAGRLPGRQERSPIAVNATLGEADHDFRVATAVTVSILSYFIQCLWLPYMDGRRLLFLGVEALRRKPIHPKYEQWFNRVGLGLIGFFVVLAIMNDVMPLLDRWVSLPR